MALRKSNREIEIKLRLPDAAAGRRMLQHAGFRLRRRRVFEANVVFDTPDGALRRQGKLLRVRQAGSRVLLTYKGAPAPGKHKSREELEVRLSDGSVFGEVLHRLGMAPSFRYEKYRTEYARPDSPGIVMVDETPIGDFLELEGPPAWIDSTARSLGFRDSDYITATYARLFLEYHNLKEGSFAEMVFRQNERSRIIRSST
jgi:adenylate cyclase class 2